MTDPVPIAGRIHERAVVGLAPWILVGVLEGSGRTVAVAAAALSLAILALVADALTRPPPRNLNVVNAACFSALLALTLLAGADGRAWLGAWLGEVGNAAAAMLILASMLVRRPLTWQYTRGRAPGRTDYILTSAWAAAFAVSALAGLYGGLALQNPSNAWTGWIVQVSALVVAAAFTS